MNELYLDLRDFWSSFIDITQSPPAYIKAMLESEILRDDYGTPQNTGNMFIVYEISDINFGETAILQARIFSRIIGNPGYIFPVLHVQEQFEERLKGKPYMITTKKGGVIMRYRGTRLLPLPADETRLGWVCGLMQYSLTNLKK